MRGKMMLNKTRLTSAEFRAALLRHYISQAFISLMVSKHSDAVFISDGESIPLSLDKVAANIIYHIEHPFIQKLGAIEGGRLAAQELNMMLKPGFMSEAMQLSCYGTMRLCRVYQDILYGAPDGEFPAGSCIMDEQDGEATL